jgi:beta-fructofuranosidase
VRRRDFIEMLAQASAFKFRWSFNPSFRWSSINGADTERPKDPNFLKAMKALLDAIPIAESDPDRPVYHFRPPANWTNDPNGPFYYNGWHHLFYQLNPFEPRIGHQHWGHARSRDQVNWEHLPIAIWPSSELGERAIFSGGAAFASDGRPRLIYTSIGDRDPEQWLVSPDERDLFLWKKYLKNPVLSQKAHRPGPVSQWRDPFMFVKDSATYMVCGGGVDGRAQVQLYRATKGDLTEWTHLGPIYQSLDRENRNFECPNLFPLQHKWVLIVSPNRPCEYWIGDLDIDAMKFEPSAHGTLDPGDAYASNISLDSKGRTILWLWGRTAPMFTGNPGLFEKKGWSGVITMPRTLSIGSDGFLQQNPIPEFESLRESVRTFDGRALGKPEVIEHAAGDCSEIEAVFSGSGTFGLELRRGVDGNPGIAVSVQANAFGANLNVGDVRAFIGRADQYKLRVFLDKRCIEVFANDGIAAVYKWFDADAKNTGVAVFGEMPPPSRVPGGRAEGALPNLVSPQPPRLESLRIWPMKGAKFSLDHFHV